MHICRIIVNIFSDITCIIGLDHLHMYIFQLDRYILPVCRISHFVYYNQIFEKAYK